jgi:hypothetical protein
MKFSFHSLTPLLPSLLNHLRLPSQEIPSIIISSGLGSSLYSLGSDPKENAVSIVTVQQYFDCCLRIRYRGNLFIESLPSNERLLWLRYSGFQASCHNILYIFKEIINYMFRSVKCNVFIIIFGLQSTHITTLLHFCFISYAYLEFPLQLQIQSMVVCVI